MALSELLDRMNTAALAVFSDAAVIVLDGATVESAVFSEPFQQGNLDGLGVSASAPQILLKSADVPNDIDGKPVIVTHQGTTRSFTVAEYLPDGFGMALLFLEAA